MPDYPAIIFIKTHIYAFYYIFKNLNTEAHHNTLDSCRKSVHWMCGSI